MKGGAKFVLNHSFWPQKTPVKPNSFHPEIALFRNLCACPVKYRAYFSGVNLLKLPPIAWRGNIRPDNESILKHLRRRCLKGIIFLLMNFGQWVEEGQ